LPCFAHQINLCVGEIFKVSPEFKTVSSQVLKIAVYFKNANNKYFIGQLRNIQEEIYGKHIQPMIPGDTRWNSYLTSCTSLIATKNAWRVFFFIFYLFFILFYKKLIILFNISL